MISANASDLEPGRRAARSPGASRRSTAGYEDAPDLRQEPDPLQNVTATYAERLSGQLLASSNIRECLIARMAHLAGRLVCGSRRARSSPPRLARQSSLTMI